VETLIFVALIGSVIDDLLAILSLIGSFILFLGSFTNAPLGRLRSIAYESIVSLAMASFFQFLMAITGTTPDKIGFAVRMSPLTVDTLLGLSLMLLIGGWWLRSNRNGPR